MRKTKIICTIGPACSDEESLRAMCLAGMNVARLNFSHGTHGEHREKIDRIKKIREELDLPVAILLDTKGPEYRIRTFREGKIFLQEGDLFTFDTRDVPGDQHRVSVNYLGLTDDLSVGDRILLNDGMLVFEVIGLTENEVLCKTLVGGELSDRKSMNFPGKVLKLTYLSEQDKEDLLFGIQNRVDFVACSFVSTKEDILDVRRFLDANGGQEIELIAKIENRSGVDNVMDIASECGGIMIGRGDMGVEIPFEQLPAIQKHLINACRVIGKRVITATEMLESMIYNPRPTRAEISDVANAVYDGTSAIMLSGETAVGKYPVLTVRTMARIAEETEKNIHYDKRFRNMEFTIRDMTDAVSHAACSLAMDIEAKVIVSCTISGITARMISRFRPPIDIIALTPYETTRRKLSMSWGVHPLIALEMSGTDQLMDMAQRVATEQCDLQIGDRIVITGGMTNAVSGNTNVLKTACI
ncbi:MAG: pyruvate kinase [Bacillota bacterium]|jgi:pyruvate kinase|nr:pyruvate kinase [Eubacteriales bacterium]MDI9491448.1 pyruvate kinase [Bacillota bacterium]NLV70556.1 pyruvate kinase [Clostridiales bacterium]MDD3536897.1 pyruvate kinase [Eubacteriales bacterium]MDD4285989.1 pyruvate kinase [Eubacteriales bacterium]